MRKYFLFLFVLTYGYCCCQDNRIVVRAKVVDALSKVPLRYASVGIKGVALGTLTNGEGEFELFIPNAYAKDSLIISYIGYRNFTALLATQPPDQVVLLQEEPIMLAEVVVRYKQLSPRDIVKKAIENVESNYQTSPFLLKGFYRSTTRVNDEYRSVLEAALKIHDPGYLDTHQRGNEIVEQIEMEAIRKTATRVYKDLPWLNEYNMLRTMLSINNVKYRNVMFDGKPHWKYTLDTITHYNNRPVYVISSGTSWTFKLYIDMETFAVYKVAVDVSNFPGWRLQRLSDSVSRKIIHFVKTVEFKEYRKKLYLNYINYEEDFQYVHPLSKKVLYTIVYHQDLSINEIATDNPPKPDSNKVLDNDVSLEKQVSGYDPSFWKRYNIIKQLSANEKLTWEVK
jgi:hypothetical protein